MVVARTFEGFSGASVSVALVVSPVITFPGTCSVIVVIWTASVASVTISKVLLKVVFLPGGGTMHVRTFYS